MSDNFGLSEGEDIPLGQLEQATTGTRVFGTEDRPDIIPGENHTRDQNQNMPMPVQPGSRPKPGLLAEPAYKEVSTLGNDTENEPGGPSGGRFGALQEQILKGAGGPDLDTTAGGMNKLPEDQRVKPEDLGINPPFEPQQGPDIHDRLIDARLNGHSWGDIQSHMAAHYDAGGTREQLGFAPAEGLMARLDGQHSQNMQVAMADDPVTGYGSMIPGVGGTGDIQRAAASMGGGFGPRLGQGAKYSLKNPVVDAAGGKSYEIHQNSTPIGTFQADFAAGGKEATVRYIGVDNPNGLAANSIGPGGTRQIGKQFFEAHPDLETVNMRRVSGAGLPRDLSISRQQVMREQ